MGHPQRYEQYNHQLISKVKENECSAGRPEAVLQRLLTPV
jgi:hypothetical protein